MVRYGLGPQSRAVYEELRGAILRGQYGPGDRLPSHTALARTFGVAPLTLRQALAELEEDGLVSRQQGRGTFVRALPALEDGAQDETVSEERFRTTFEKSAIGIAHIDASGRWLRVNQRLCDMLGYTPDELVRLRFQEITPAEDLVDLSEWTQLIAGKIQTYCREKRFLRKDRSHLWVNLTISAARDQFGNIAYVIGMVEDITERKNVEQALRESEERYRIMFDGAPIGISLSNLDGYIIVANEAYQKMLGYTERELRGLRFTDVTHPEDIQADLDLWDEVMNGRRDGYEMAKRYIRKDGQVIWVRLTVVVVRDQDGSPRYDVAMVEDITERRQAEEALRESEARHRQMFERNHAIKLLIDPFSGSIVDANPAACAFYGYTLDELRARRIADINVLSPDQSSAEMTRALAKQRAHFVFRHRLASGEIRHVEVHSSPVETNGRTLLYSIVHDVTEQKRFEEQLEHQALHDSLTNLPNRVLLHDRLQHALHAARRHGTDVALLLMDLDRFKDINDTFGHHYGDLLLEQYGARLRDSLRQSDTVARLGGDEFAVILPDTDAQGAQSVADKLLELGHEPFVLDGHTLAIDASVGIALYPNHGADPGTLLRRADVAMYHAKRGGKGYAVYASERDEYSPRRLTLMNELRQAIDTDQLILHYQPKLDLRSGHVGSVEALVRWQHPQLGTVSPGEFVPLAEHTGLVKPLTSWVLCRALRQSRRWRENGLEVRVEVNLSARSLHDRRLVEMIAEALEVEDAQPSWLGLEVTEGAVMADADSAMTALQQISGMGVGISIDDFGTGYSSLRYLDQLPASALKIDRSFVYDMVENKSHARIVQGTVNLAHDLTLEVVAEGVEDARTLEALTTLGCDFAQGYFLSPPIPAEECTRWLQAHAAFEKGPQRDQLPVVTPRSSLSTSAGAISS